MSRLTKYLLTNNIMVVNRCHEPHPPSTPTPPPNKKGLDVYALKFESTKAVS